MPVHLVTHSFGGLVGRHFLRAFDRDPSQPLVHRFVTLDSPHGGIARDPDSSGDLFDSTFFSEPHLNGVFQNLAFRGFSPTTRSVTS